MWGWVRDRALGLTFFTLFVVAWIAQYLVQYQEYKLEQHDHGQSVESILSSDYMASFWSATLENWQSEFLQLASFVILSAYLVYKGASESSDTEERMEAMLEAIARKHGIDPAELEKELSPKHRKRT